MRMAPWGAAATRLGLRLTTAAAVGTAALVATVPLAAAARASGPGGTIASVSPTVAAPGRPLQFTVSCASLGAAAATLLGQPLRLPAIIPMNAAPREGDFVVAVRLPSGVRPGSYHPRIECSDGTAATIALQVESAAAAAAARAAAASERAADGVVASPVSAGLAAVGVALMAVGALAGGSALALRRRVRSHP